MYFDASYVPTNYYLTYFDRMTLQEYRRYFDTYLQQRLDEKLTEVRPLFPDEQTFELLSYLKPYVDHGKRFRPYMVYLWYTLYGGSDIEYITKVWCIHELIHIFALIHDDICDKGTMRHKIPSYHTQLTSKYDDEHFGLSQAILVGDLVYTWAMQEAAVLLASTTAQWLVYTMLNEVVIGQMLDVDYSTLASSMKTTKEIANKDHLKSWQYTFQKPMMVWASLAWVDDLAHVEALWKKIWIAFQMRDDLLDRLPNKEGKTNMSDIQEGNQTIVMSTCREAYNDEAWNRLRENKGKVLSSLESQVLHRDFEEFDIANKVLSKIHLLLDEVEAWVATIWWAEAPVQEFLEVVEMLRGV